MKKALIITYYWPPSGGAGVQRWLKFVKYMRSFGWEPVVFTPDNPEMPVVDESLLKDIPPDLTVIKRPIWEPYAFYKALSGRKKSDRINASFLSEKKKKRGLVEKLSVWVRGNFFVPDARRFWVAPSVSWLDPYLRKEGIGCIVSSGPPHSMHLIAAALRRRNPSLRWVADFRDPWTNIDFYDQLMLGSRADRMHKRMELDVLKSADAVVGVGATMTRELQDIYTNGGGKNPGKFSVITNGFDAADLLPGEIKKDEKFTLAHIGTLVKDRNPRMLWKVLSGLLAELPAMRAMLEIKLVGKVDYQVREDIASFGLANYVRYIDYLPHNEVVREQRQSRVLLLLVNNTRNAKGIITGKIFEYMATGVPVLAIGPPDGDLAGILAETRSGLISGFGDEEALRKHVLSLFSGQPLESDPDAIGKYSRHELTRAYCALLDAVTRAR